MYLFRLELEFCHEQFFLVRIEIGILKCKFLVTELECMNYIELEC